MGDSPLLSIVNAKYPSLKTKGWVDLNNNKIQDKNETMEDWDEDGKILDNDYYHYITINYKNISMDLLQQTLEQAIGVLVVIKPVVVAKPNDLSVVPSPDKSLIWLEENGICGSNSAKAFDLFASIDVLAVSNEEDLAKELLLSNVQLGLDLFKFLVNYLQRKNNKLIKLLVSEVVIDRSVMAHKYKLDPNIEKYLKTTFSKEFIEVEKQLNAEKAVAEKKVIDEANRLKVEQVKIEKQAIEQTLQAVDLEFNYWLAEEAENAEKVQKTNEQQQKVKEVQSKVNRNEINSIPVQPEEELVVVNPLAVLEWPDKYEAKIEKLTYWQAEQLDDQQVDLFIKEKILGIGKTNIALESDPDLRKMALKTLRIRRGE